MRKKRHIQHRNISSPAWLKWTMLIVILLVIGSLSYSIYLYVHIEKQKAEGFHETKQHVLEETELIYIDRIKRFHSEKDYHIVFGLDEHGKDNIVFVSLSNDEKFLVINNDDFVAEQFVYEQWTKSCDQCKFIQITPAIIENNPLWEITYVDHADKYTFDYVSIYDGKPYEQLQLQQMFK